MRNQQSDGYKDKACLNVTIKIGDPPPQGPQGAHSETWCLDYSSHPFPAFVFVSPTQVHLLWNLEETFSHHPGTCFFPVFSICIAVICSANCLPCIVPWTTLIYLRFTSPLDRDLEASTLTGFFFALARCVRSQEVLESRSTCWWILKVFRKEESFESISWLFSFWFCKFERKKSLLIPSRKNSLIAAPSAASSKIKVPAPQPIVKRDRRQNSSRLSASNNRELQKLPSLKGNFYYSSCES